MEWKNFCCRSSLSS